MLTTASRGARTIYTNIHKFKSRTEEMRDQYAQSTKGSDNWRGVAATFRKAEGAEKRGRMAKAGKNGENSENVQLRKRVELRRVVVEPMSKLMC